MRCPRSQSDAKGEAIALRGAPGDGAYWHIVGFPQGIGPFYQGGITIHDDGEDDDGGQELESQNADTFDGDSGAPLFGFWKDDPRIVGVVSGVASEHNPDYEENHVMAGGPGVSAKPQPRPKRVRIRRRGP